MGPPSAGRCDSSDAAVPAQAFVAWPATASVMPQGAWNPDARKKVILRLLFMEMNVKRFRRGRGRLIGARCRLSEQCCRVFPHYLCTLADQRTPVAVGSMAGPAGQPSDRERGAVGGWRLLKVEAAANAATREDARCRCEAGRLEGADGRRRRGTGEGVRRSPHARQIDAGGNERALPAHAGRASARSLNAGTSHWSRPRPPARGPGLASASACRVPRCRHSPDRSTEHRRIRRCHSKWRRRRCSLGKHGSRPQLPRARPTAREPSDASSEILSLNAVQRLARACRRHDGERRASVAGGRPPRFAAFLDEIPNRPPRNPRVGVVNRSAGRGKGLSLGRKSRGRSFVTSRTPISSGPAGQPVQVEQHVDPDRVFYSSRPAGFVSEIARRGPP